jgi:protein TonB
MSAGGDEPDVLDTRLLPPPAPDVPDAPKQIARPAAPVIVMGDLDPDVTIPSIPGAWSRPDLLTPPPAARGEDLEIYRQIMPSMVPPRVLNQQEVERALVRQYPSMLRAAGIGGDVRVLLWLDENGAITRAEIDQSSGREALDSAALEVVKVMRLTPALNGSRPTRVIVSLPVRFVAR